MSESVTFWYGCNVLRHGDIIHACLDILRALGFEPHPVGGPDYCCGTVKDANQTTAGGMATRTVGRLNERAAPVVAWCPSCHSHMHDFMEHAAERRHARKAHHHLRVDVLRARRHAHAATRAHADPAERLRRAGLAAQHRVHAADHRFAIGSRRLRVLRHRADLIALAAARARAEDALDLALLEFLEPLAYARSRAHACSKLKR